MPGNRLTAEVGNDTLGSKSLSASAGFRLHFDTISLRMPLTLANQRIQNPTTGISYRLMADAGSWRITRASPVGNVVALVHLRGTEGVGVVPGGVVERFVAGYGIDETIIASASTSIRQVLIADFRVTSERLTEAAARARRGFNGGLPGLRPRSPAMRQRFEVAYAALHDAWKSMAATWGEAFGRENVVGLPDWLVAAWEYKGETWERAAALAALEGPED